MLLFSVYAQAIVDLKLHTLFWFSCTVKVSSGVQDIPTTAVYLHPTDTSLWLPSTSVLEFLVSLPLYIIYICIPRAYNTNSHILNKIHSLMHTYTNIYTYTRIYEVVCVWALFTLYHNTWLERDLMLNENYGLRPIVI